jgi:AraC family transcriptional regulator
MATPQVVQQKNIPVLDYQRKPDASNLVLPKSPTLHSGVRGHNWHFEVQNQPAHDTAEHRHKMHIVTMVTSGTPVDQYIDGRWESNLIGQNNIFILPADALHRCSWSGDIEFMFMALDTDLFVQIGQELVDTDSMELIPHFATVQDTLIQGILQTLKHEFMTQGVASDLFVDRLRETLVMHLLRSYGVQKVQIAHYADGLSRHKLNRVIEYINAHLDRRLELWELAQQIDMSQFYFSRLFKKSLRVTPHQYVIQQRVERAQKLLKKGELSLAEIALECGFANQGHLNRHFKRLRGTTPKEIARMYKTGKII